MDLNEEIEIASATEPSVGDFFVGMKVVDLKKELKARGLPVTGNKTELIERLQEAQNTTTKDFDHFNAESSDRISELGSRDLLSEDSFFDDAQFSSPEKTTKEISVSDHQLITLDESALKSNISRPLKKRLIAAKDSNPVEKKLQLNRSDPVQAPFFTSTSPPASKPVTQGRKLITVAEPEKNGESQKSIASLKTLTQSEKLAKRAERFNVKSSAETDKTSTKLVSAVPKVGTRKPITLSDSSNTADIDVLKRRAERFGQNVSTVMKQIEEKEKILKRKLKFGANVSAVAGTNLDDQEMKKKRAERFCIS